MMDKKGGFVEIAVALVVIVLASVVWVILGHTGIQVTDLSMDVIPDNIGDQTVNKTAIGDDFDTVNNIWYIALFFIIITVLIWVVKVTVQEKALGR